MSVGTDILAELRKAVKGRRRENRVIYTNILAICEKWGIPIRKLERDCGIGNGVVRRWDEGHADVWLVKVAADYLGVTVDDLLREPDGVEKAADKGDRRRKKAT